MPKYSILIIKRRSKAETYYDRWTKRTWQMIKVINMHAYVIRFYKITIKQKDVKPCIWKMNKDLR